MTLAVARQSQQLRNGALQRTRYLRSSALPLIVRGLDRARERDDIRRKNLDEKAVFAWSRPTLGGHAVVEHPEEGRFATRDRVLHLL